MNKDVIYIDVDDDITAIISKINDSKEDIVALVPPKRIGVLQSAVNLRLMNRAAKATKKKLVLVTNNQALVGLAAAARIPIAKNLQSKPELASMPTSVSKDQEDIIDGEQLSVGEHDSQGKKPSESDARDAVATSLVAAEKAGPGAMSKKPRAKVPDFNNFRKRLVLIGGGVVVLLVLLIWAIFFAAHATVVIAAKTTGTSINQLVTVSTKTPTDFNKQTIQATVEQDQNNQSVDFTATGTKDVGKQATGTVNFSNNTLSSTTINAGTPLTSSSGLQFTLDTTVTVPAGSVSCVSIMSCSGTPGVASGSVTAAANGDKYNGATGNLSGTPGGITASFASPTSGGVSKNVPVVTDADVQKAKDQIASSVSSNEKSQLKAKFAKSDIVLSDSFDVSYSNVAVSPDVGQEDDGGKATLKTTVTYSLYGVSHSELNKYLNAYMKSQLSGTNNQRVYKNGSDGANFQQVTKAADGAKAALVATAQVGPAINDDQVKKEAAGKKLGDVQQQLLTIQGVQNVDVKFFPFWVTTVPNNVHQISIQFKVNESH